MKKVISMFLSLTLILSCMTPMIVGADTEKPVGNTSAESEQLGDKNTENQDAEQEQKENQQTETNSGTKQDYNEEKNQEADKNNQTEIVDNDTPVTESSDSSQNETDMNSTDTPSDSSLVSVSSGGYEIASALAKDKLLEIEGSSKQNSAKAQLWDKDNDRGQKFKIEDQGNGWYVIRVLHSDKVLDVYGASEDNGARVQQYTYNGSDAQLWRFEEAGDGYVYIQSKIGTVLDCAGASSLNGTVVQTYSLNESTAQKWKLTASIYWVDKDGQRYLYQGDSVLTGWQQVGGLWYYMNTSGAMQKGFVEIENSTFYLDPSKGTRVTGWQIIEGNDYYFNNDGVMQKNTTIEGIQLGDNGAAVFQYVNLEDGIYTIGAAESKMVATISGASKNSGARIELQGNTYSDKEQFKITAVNDGWYKIENVLSGKALDVASASKENGAVLQQYNYNGTDAQLWRFIDSGNGSYFIRSKLGTCLDCPSGSKNSGTKIQMYKLNFTSAQKWVISTDTQPPLNDIGNGVYQITGFESSNRVISLGGLEKGNNVAFSLRSQTYGSFEQFNIVKLDNGWYKIVNKYSGKALDVNGANSNNGAIVQQYTDNGSHAQQWRFVDAGNGFSYIQSRLGTFLDRKDGSSNEGTKIQTYSLNYSNAQKWKIEAPKNPDTIGVTDGDTYLITSKLNTNRVLDISGGSTANGANVQLWTEEVVSQQKFQIISTGDGWYKIVSKKSGKVLDVAGGSANAGANVQQYAWNGSDAQKFRFVNAGDGSCYIQSKLGTYLDCAGGTSKNGTNIQMYLLNKSNAQKFRLDNVSQKNYVRSTVLSDYTCRITIYNPNGGDINSILFPTWSVTNGQDDIKWLNGTKNSDGSWSVLVDSDKFNSGGAYLTHVYGKKGNSQSYLGSASYTLKKNVEGWVYVDGYRRYRNADGTLMNDVSNIFNPSSKSITVDRIRGITTIYGYNSQTGKYDTPIKAMWCSVGNPISLTKAGTYNMGWQLRVKEMNASDGSYRCWAPYVSQIYGLVYFHGVSSNTPDLKTVTAGSFRGLGSPASHGCVRLAAVDARWIYYNTSSGTTVKVGDGLGAPMNPVRYQWVGGAVGPDPTYY